MRRITRGWHRAVAARAGEGNNVIVDELLLHRWWLSDWSEILDGYRWWSVRLTASVAELTRREANRADRPPGMAAEDAARAPDANELFDLVINPEAVSVADCVSSISELIG
jgi:chloramphenicol 3-O phosphotransferase